jgi:hypothetical protein
MKCDPARQDQQSCDRGPRLYPDLGGRFPLLLSIVMLMSLGIITARAEVSGVTQKETIAQESEDIARVNEAELTLGPQSAHAPDPRLVEFVRLLARRAAREWYEQIVEERRPKRSCSRGDESD